MKNSLYIAWGLGIGDWGLGIGDWGLGSGPNAQFPIPDPQCPRIMNFKQYLKLLNIKIYE